MKLFLYNEDAKLTQYALRQIRKCGYLPIQVKLSIDVNMIDTEQMPIKMDAVTRAAFRAINATSYDAVRQTFGRFVSEEMLK